MKKCNDDNEDRKQLIGPVSWMFIPSNFFCNNCDSQKTKIISSEQTNFIVNFSVPEHFSCDILQNASWKRLLGVWKAATATQLIYLLYIYIIYLLYIYYISDHQLKLLCSRHSKIVHLQLRFKWIPYMCSSQTGVIMLLLYRWVCRSVCRSVCRRGLYLQSPAALRV